MEKNHYAEIVVQQESQIVPAFIFVLEKTSLQKFSRDWNRAVASEAESTQLTPLDCDSRDSIDVSTSLLSLDDRSENV